MNDLNEMLKKRAEKKLKDEINKFIYNLREHKFFSSFESVTVNLKKDESEPLRTFFWDGGYTAGKMIMEKFLPNYVEDEAKNFMEKVDNLENEINDLKNPNT